MTFAHYLAAKKSVDDRALNRRVWERLREELAGLETLGTRGLRVLELGAGIGTGLERWLDWGLFPAAAASLSYELVDREPALLKSARERLSGREPSPELVFHTAEARSFCRHPTNAGRFDLLIGQALLDLLDLSQSLPEIRRVIGPRGLAYFPITFDGMTAFEPSLQEDEAILTIYHRSMDERLVEGEPSGDSRSGRHLLRYLSEAPFELLEVGSSDWIVNPTKGTYPHQEGFFLRSIIETIERAVSARPEADKTATARWARERQRQIERGELLYLAHQLDLLVRLTDD